MALPRPDFKPQYDHFINGEFVAPIDGAYFDNISPIDGQVFTRAARGNAKGIEIRLSSRLHELNSF